MSDNPLADELYYHLLVPTSDLTLHLQRAQELLSAHPELAHALDSDDDTPLHHAANWANMDIVRQLQSLGADVNAQNRARQTPLLRAVINGGTSGPARGLVDHQVELVELLLAAGADPNLADRHASTPLHEAKGVLPKSDEKRRRIVQLLLQHGADPRARHDWRGTTVLHRMACHPEIIRLLVEHGADVNATNDKGETPLHQAAKDCQADALSTLISLGANIHLQDQEGRTLLHYAVWYPPNFLRVQALLEAGADPNVKDKEGYTPLHIAASVHAFESVRLLLAAGADVNARNNQGETPLAIVDDQTYLGWDISTASENWAEEIEPMLTLLKEAGGQL